MFNISEFNNNDTVLAVTNTSNATDSSQPSSSTLEKFPTIGLKCLLQNSDLLDQLLNPNSASTTSTSSSNTTTTTTTTTDATKTPVSLTSTLSSVPLELAPTADTEKLAAILPADQVKDWSKEFELLDNNKNESNTDSGLFENILEFSKSDKEDENVNQSKQYGNAFLGQNLWDKNDMFQGDKLSGVKFQTVDFDDFLNENNLNEKEMEFLFKMQIKDTANTTGNTVNTSETKKITTAGNNNNSTLSSTLSSSNELSQQQQQQQQQPINEPKLMSKSSINTTATIDEEDLDITYINDEKEDDDLNCSDFNVSIGKKSKKQFVPDGMKDDRYWARRTKNNFAAKRSRDARRIKESQIAVRATLLERENESLKRRLDNFERESRVMKMKLARYEALDLNNANTNT